MWTNTAPRPTTRSIVIFAVTTVITASLLALMWVRLIQAGNAASNVNTSPLINRAAPDFAITPWNMPTSQTIRLDSFKGHPVVVNFWGSWCAQCQEEQAIFQTVWQQYQHQGVQFIGIAYNDKQDTGSAYLKQYAVTYPAGPPQANTTPVDYSVTGAPETVFIGRDGIVKDKVLGPMDQASLEREIQQLLK